MKTLLHGNNVIKLFCLMCVWVIFAGCVTPPREQSKTPTTAPTNTDSTKTAQSTPTPTPELKPIEVDAKALFQIYQENQYKADEMYTNKLVLVSGTVDKVTKGVVDERYYIGLKTSNMFMHVCIYPKDEAVMRDIKPNQKLKALGICKGDKAGIVIEDAELK